MAVNRVSASVMAVNRVSVSVMAVNRVSVSILAVRGRYCLIRLDSPIYSGRHYSAQRTELLTLLFVVMLTFWSINKTLPEKIGNFKNHFIPAVLKRMHAGPQCQSIMTKIAMFFLYPP